MSGLCLPRAQREKWEEQGCRGSPAAPGGAWSKQLGGGAQSSLSLERSRCTCSRWRKQRGRRDMRQAIRTKCLLSFCAALQEGSDG